MKAKESLKYNGKVLLRERKKQKLSRIDVALKLTLNEHQIKSIEENDFLKCETKESFILFEDFIILIFC